MLFTRKQLGTIDEALQGMEHRIRQSGQDKRADEIKDIIEMVHSEIDRQITEKTKTAN